MKFKRPFMKAIARVSLAAFVNFILLFYYPGGVRAGEGLSISGFEVKTPAFKPYRIDLPSHYTGGKEGIHTSSGEFSFFLNQKALVNAELQDKEFNLVRSLELMRGGKEGENTISWNGRDEEGEFVKSGEYIFSITAMAEDGSSAIISKEVEIEFEAPRGTELKPRIWEIEGKPKKPHVNEAPLSLSIGKWGPPGQRDKMSACIGSLVCLPIALPVAILEIWNKNRNPDLHTFYYEEDYEALAEINKEIDEYNAELEAEIAEENREIDEHNFKIKDAIVVRMELAD